MDETTKAAMESGRPLTIFHIKEVHQLNPNATHITNHYYGDQFVPKDMVRQEPSAPENVTRNLVKNRFWSMRCVCTLRMSARSGKKNMRLYGKASSNCLQSQPSSTTRASSKEPPSTAIWWETFCICWLRRRS